MFTFVKHVFLRNVRMYAVFQHECQICLNIDAFVYRFLLYGSFTPLFSSKIILAKCLLRDLGISLAHVYWYKTWSYKWIRAKTCISCADGLIHYVKLEENINHLLSQRSSKCWLIELEILALCHRVDSHEKWSLWTALWVPLTNSQSRVLLHIPGISSLYSYDTFGETFMHFDNFIPMCYKRIMKKKSH